MGEVALTRQQLKGIEHAIATELEPIDMPLQHAFIPGVYARSLTIPQGGVLVGKVHSTVHICIVAKGRILVATEGQAGKVELVAGDMFVSEPGAKRVGYAIEETVFINVHSNEDNDTDLGVLESKLITPELIGYEQTKEITWHGPQ